MGSHFLAPKFFQGSFLHLKTFSPNFESLGYIVIPGSPFNKIQSALVYPKTFRAHFASDKNLSFSKPRLDIFVNPGDLFLAPIILFQPQKCHKAHFRTQKKKSPSVAVASSAEYCFYYCFRILKI